MVVVVVVFVGYCCLGSGSSSGCDSLCKSGSCNSCNSCKSTIVMVVVVVLIVVVVVVIVVVVWWW